MFMSERMRALQEALKVAIEKRNPVLEASIRNAIREEEKRPLLEG